MSAPPPGHRAILTSGALYGAAFLITTVLHEAGHFAVSLACGRAPVLYHNSVISQHTDSLAVQVGTTLAGPLLSAAQGALFWWLERRARRRSPALRLLLVWLCFHGFMNAAGYLFTTAFVPDADLGSAARALGTPALGLIALSGLGFWLIRVSARWIYPGFVALLPRDGRDEVGARNRGLIRLGVLAWPVGVLTVLPASLPVPHWLSLTYVLIAGVGTVWFTDFSKAGEGGPSESLPLPDTAPAWPWVLWAALTGLCVLVLRGGVSLG